jgi:excisionase family DNA binding protein
MRTELQTVLNTVRDLTPEQLPELLGELETIRATAMLKMATPIPAQQLDELLPVTAAAKRIGVSTDYLYRHAGRMPFTRRVGRKLLFSSRAVEQYINRARR